MNNDNSNIEERTFTQEEVNRIVGERLAKEKIKSDTSLAEREQELNRREALLDVKEEIRRMSLPMELVDVIDVKAPTKVKEALNAIKNAIDNNEGKTHEIEPNPLPLSQCDYPNTDSEIRKAMGLPT